MNYVTDQSIPKDEYVLKRVIEYAEYKAKNNEKIKPLDLLSSIRQHQFDYDMDKFNREDYLYLNK